MSRLVECACAFPYVIGDVESEGSHAVVHATWARGPREPALNVLPAVSTIGEFRILWVDLSMGDSLRRAAADAAYIECREMSHPVCWDGGTESANIDPRMVLATDPADRIIAMVMVAEVSTHWLMRWGPARAEVEDRRRVKESRPGIGRAWIAGNYRGRGIGTAMVRHISAALGVPPCDLVWTIPLSPAGERLVRRLCPERWLADGSVADVRVTLGEDSDG